MLFYPRSLEQVTSTHATLHTADRRSELHGNLKRVQAPHYAVLMSFFQGDFHSQDFRHLVLQVFLPTHHFPLQDEAAIASHSRVRHSFLLQQHLSLPSDVSPLPQSCSLNWLIPFSWGTDCCHWLILFGGTHSPWIMFAFAWTPVKIWNCVLSQVKSLWGLLQIKKFIQVTASRSSIFQDR